MDDLKDCILTFQDTYRHLQQIEFNIAIKLNIKDNIHKKLLELSDEHKLDDNFDLVKDWHATYSLYIDWLENTEENNIENYICSELYLYNQECNVYSFVKTENDHYKNILKLGKRAVPTLLKHLDYFHPWAMFNLLDEITNCDFADFPEECNGVLDKVKKYWIEYGNKNGYIV